MGWNIREAQSRQVGSIIDSICLSKSSISLRNFLCVFKELSANSPLPWVEGKLVFNPSRFPRPVSITIKISFPDSRLIFDLSVWLVLSHSLARSQLLPQH